MKHVAILFQWDALGVYWAPLEMLMALHVTSVDAVMAVVNIQEVLSVDMLTKRIITNNMVSLIYHLYDLHNARLFLNQNSNN